MGPDRTDGAGQTRWSPRRHPRRRIVDAILYLDRTGCSWRQLPHDFPPWRSVYGYFRQWAEDNTTDRIHDALRDAVRDADGRDPMASAGIVDSQSVKGADTVSKNTRGYDAGKKINGHKRHIVTDTLGLLIVVMVTSAALQDRDGGRLVLERAKMKMPSMVLVWADGGYAGTLLAFAHHRFRILVEIIKRTDKRPTFEVLPRRWVIERTNSWLMQTPRLARDYERLPKHSLVVTEHFPDPGSVSIDLSIIESVIVGMAADVPSSAALSCAVLLLLLLIMASHSNGGTGTFASKALPAGSGAAAPELAQLP